MVTAPNMKAYTPTLDTSASKEQIIEQFEAIGERLDELHWEITQLQNTHAPTWQEHARLEAACKLRDFFRHKWDNHLYWSQIYNLHD